MGALLVTYKGRTLDVLQPRVILLRLAVPAAQQDLLDQLNSLGYRLTIRLILVPVVLDRRCRRHIYILKKMGISVV